MNKLVQGVGINDVGCVTKPTVDGKQQMCPFYRAWSNMLKRCYSERLQAKYPTYIGCMVCEEWHSFMTFRSWMIQQDWQGKDLDKDLLIAGNKIYSPETCIFVSSQINSLLNDHGAARGEFPIGVDWYVRDQKFRAQCRINGKQKYLGYFTDPYAAHRAWQQFKIKVIHEATAYQADAQLVAALNRVAAKIQSDFDLNLETKSY